MLERPFRGSDAVARGLLTPGRLRGRRYRSLFPDVYVAAGTSTDLSVLSCAAYLLVAHRGGAVGGWSAAELLGAACAPARVPAEVIVPGDGGVRAHRGLRVHREGLDPGDVVRARGCRVTSPLRTAWDLARREGLFDAVAAVDALARCGRFDPVELLARRATAPGARHCRRLDEVVALADPRAESRMESELRLMLVLGGLPRPEVQFRVLDEYGFVLARTDLAYPAARLALEYDGEEHFTRTRGVRDRRRDAALAAIGWHTERFTVGDVDLHPPQTVRRVAHLLAERLPR